MWRSLPEELVTEEAEPYHKETPEKTMSRATFTGQPVSLTSPSTLALIAANLAPVAGMILFGWNLGDVMILHWGESAVIGFYNLLKIAVYE